MIRAKNLSKMYHDVRAVQDVSFEITTPGSTILFGRSGSGKTTLLRLLAGLEIPDAGEIYLENKLVSKQGAAFAPHHRNIGFVFQQPALWPHMKISENIGFGLYRLGKKEAEERVQEVLEQTGLSALAGRYPDQVSAGQARRAALARAIAPKPKYLLMDEPLTNIDTQSKEALITLIQDISRDKQTFILYVSHDAQEVQQISGRILKIENGRLQ